MAPTAPDARVTVAPSAVSRTSWDAQRRESTASRRMGPRSTKLVSGACQKRLGRGTKGMQNAQF